MAWTLPFEGIDIEIADGYSAGDFFGEFDFDQDGDVIAVRLKVTRRIGAEERVRLVPLAMVPLADLLATAIQAAYRDTMAAILEEEIPSRRDPFAGGLTANSAGRRL